MELKRYNSLMPRLHRTSTISAGEIIQALYEQLLNPGSGGRWVIMMTGKIIILSGLNGSQTKYWAV